MIICTAIGGEGNGFCFFVIVINLFHDLCSAFYPASTMFQNLTFNFPNQLPVGSKQALRTVGDCQLLQETICTPCVFEENKVIRFVKFRNSASIGLFGLVFITIHNLQ